LDLQRGIAEVLRVLDDLIDTNRGLMAALEARSFASCSMAAEGAAMVPLADFAERVRKSVRPNEVKKGVPYLGLEHFALEAGGLTGIGSTSSVTSIAQQFDAGEVLYGKLRPYFRKVARPGFDGVCTSEAWVLRPRDGLGGAYLHWITAAPAFTDHASAGSEGTRMPRADWDHVSRYLAPVPDPERLARLESLLQPLWQLYWDLFEESRALATTRDELLPLLMAGRVRPREVTS
jgi:type I restriction enzyme S subunit